MTQVNEILTMQERPAKFGLQGWHGLTWRQVTVIGETSQRYRVRLEEDARLPGRRRHGKRGDVLLMPKHAIWFREAEE